MDHEDELKHIYCALRFCAQWPRNEKKHETEEVLSLPRAQTIRRGPLTPMPVLRPVQSPPK